MINQVSLSACASAAWIILAFCTGLRAQRVPDVPGIRPDQTIAKMIKDLEEKAKTLSEERALQSVGADDHQQGSQAHGVPDGSNRAMAEILRCLIERNNLKHSVIPSDPFYRALRRKRLVEADLETARIWWIHCREGTPHESLDRLGDLPLAASLKEEKERAEVEIAATEIAEEPNDTAVLRPLRSPVTVRLKEGIGILDQIQDWKDLSEESKSKIIAR